MYEKRFYADILYLSLIEYKVGNKRDAWTQQMISCLGAAKDGLGVAVLDEPSCCPF